MAQWRRIREESLENKRAAMSPHLARATEVKADSHFAQTKAEDMMLMLRLCPLDGTNLH